MSGYILKGQEEDHMPFPGLHALQNTPSVLLLLLALSQQLYLAPQSETD